MAQENLDLSSLDRPEISAIAFHPRRSSRVQVSRPNSEDHLIEVEKGVKIGCRFHRKHSDCPSLLYFHGNAEIVDDFDDSAALYNNIGVNFFVTDYRGYGFSDDTPTVTKMIKDSHRIFDSFGRIASSSPALFVMGTSAGSIPAVEVVYHHQDEVRGLIIESGAANNFRQYIGAFVPPNNPILSDESPFLNKVKLRSISTPTLIIHGEKDEDLPLEEARELYNSSAAKIKRLEIVPNANHNSVMTMGREQCYRAIEEFVKACSEDIWAKTTRPP